MNPPPIIKVSIEGAFRVRDCSAREDTAVETVMEAVRWLMEVALPMAKKLDADERPQPLV